MNGSKPIKHTSFSLSRVLMFIFPKLALCCHIPKKEKNIQNNISITLEKNSCFTHGGVEISPLVKIDRLAARLRRRRPRGVKCYKHHFITLKRKERIMIHTHTYIYIMFMHKDLDESTLSPSPTTPISESIGE